MLCSVSASLNTAVHEKNYDDAPRAYMDMQKGFGSLPLYRLYLMDFRYFGDMKIEDFVGEEVREAFAAPCSSKRLLETNKSNRYETVKELNDNLTDQNGNANKSRMECEGVHNVAADRCVSRGLTFGFLKDLLGILGQRTVAGQNSCPFFFTAMLMRIIPPKMPIRRPIVSHFSEAFLHGTFLLSFIMALGVRYLILRVTGKCGL